MSVLKDAVCRHAIPEEGVAVILFTQAQSTSMSFSYPVPSLLFFFSLPSSLFNIKKCSSNDNHCSIACVIYLHADANDLLLYQPRRHGQSNLRCGVMEGV